MGGCNGPSCNAHLSPCWSPGDGNNLLACSYDDLEKFNYFLGTNYTTYFAAQCESSFPTSDGIVASFVAQDTCIQCVNCIDEVVASPTECCTNLLYANVQEFGEEKIPTFKGIFNTYFNSQQQRNYFLIPFQTIFTYFYLSYKKSNFFKKI